MADASHGLSDVLRQMADSPGAPRSASPARQEAVDQTPAELAAAEPIDDESGERVGAAQARPAAARRPVHPAPADPSAGLKMLAVPVLLAVGLLLMVPGCWAVLRLLGVDVPLSDRPNVDVMAKVMLTCLPIAAILLAGAGFFYAQARAARKPQGRAPRRA